LPSVYLPDPPLFPYPRLLPVRVRAPPPKLPERPHFPFRLLPAECLHLSLYIFFLRPPCGPAICLLTRLPSPPVTATPACTTGMLYARVTRILYAILEFAVRQRHLRPLRLIFSGHVRVLRPPPFRLDDPTVIVPFFLLFSSDLPFCCCGESPISRDRRFFSRLSHPISVTVGGHVDRRPHGILALLLSQADPGARFLWHFAKESFSGPATELSVEGFAILRRF